ncbi:patched domain-containing protein 3-like [Centruroides vittatus]|uniref:patched domain-containing protein 3-like n=1 Tax=Centruroides vittatus TaxID=120091 RepID=UPI00350F938C
MKSNCIEKAVSKYLGRLGGWIGRHPVICIVAPIVITIICSTAFFTIKYETNIEYLYTPINGINRRNGQYLKNMFPNDVATNFEPGRMTSFGQWVWIIVLSKDEGSMLRTSSLKQLIKVDDFVQNITIRKDKRVYTFGDLCAKKDDECYLNPIISVAKMTDLVNDGTKFVKYPIDLDLSRYNYTYYALNLGGVTSDGDKVKAAKAVRLVYFLDDSTTQRNQLSERWQLKVVDELLKKDFENLTVTMFTTMSIDSEMQRVVEGRFFLYSISVAFMVIFAILTTISTDWIHSKPWIGIFATFSCGLALTTGFGICIYCGVPYIHINIASGFLMLGIGMDDSFVILSAWRRTSKKKSVEDRLAETYSEAAVSITITSLTNLISFLIGIITPFPSIRIFCLYTAITVVATYLYQLIFVGGCLAACGLAEENNRHSFTFLRIPSESSSKNRNYFYKIFCTVKERENSHDVKNHFLMVFFRDQVGGFLTKKYTKIGVVIVFIIYLAVAIWGCTIVTEANDIRNYLPHHSYATEFFHNFNTYFNKYRDRIQIVIDKELDYSDINVQNEVEELLQKYEASSYVGEPILTESWLRYYLMFLKDKRMAHIVKNFNITSKQDFLTILRRIFLLHPSTRHFKDDIIFNDNYTEIVASRFLLQTNITTIDHTEKYMVQELRDIAASASFPVLVFSPVFSVIDLVFVVVPTTIQTTSIAAAVMIIVCFIFIPNLSCALWVAVSVISIEIGVVGYMALWNVSLDATSMVILVMCIGFSVDYSAHISYCYIKAKGDMPDEKLKEALYAVGMAIFQAAFSTLIGVVFISLVPAMTFFILFKVIFLVVSFASLHGMIFLPVFLSITDQIILRFNSGKATITNNKSLSDVFSSEKGQVILSRANWIMSTNMCHSGPYINHPIAGPQVNLAFVSDR